MLYFACFIKYIIPMKKRLIFSVVLSLLVLMGIGVSSAADGILDFLDFAAKQDDTFGYSSSDVLDIEDISNSSIDVASPVVKVWNNNREVTSYIFNLSTARSNDEPVAYWCFYDISSDITSNGSKFRVSLDTSSLEKDEIYYLYATPVDWLTLNGDNGKCTLEDVKNFFDYGLFWRDSMTNGKDPCLSLQDRIYGEWRYCENHQSGTSSTTSTASVYAIRNVSHTYNWKNITLTWESLGADIDVEILLWYESSQSFKRIWTVNSEDKSFTFKAVHNWDHIVKFKMESPYQDINYTAHYLEETSPEVTPVQPSTPVKPVVVWPKENILMIVFGTLILYIVYRIAVRKRS